MKRNRLAWHFITQLLIFAIPLIIAYRYWIKFTAHEQYYDNDKALDTLIVAAFWVLAFTAFVLVKTAFYFFQKVPLWKPNILFLLLLAVFLLICFNNKYILENFLKRNITDVEITYPFTVNKGYDSL